MRYATKKKFLYLVFIILVLILLLHGDITRKTNVFIEKRKILSVLHDETSENFTSTAIVDCDYYDIIYDDTKLPLNLIDGDSDIYRIKKGGEYAPTECKARFSTAIVVPYRDRAELLRSFLVYMHSFLRRQYIHYRIYVVEQVDSQPYNRAKLINIGAVTAMRAGYPCLILHDIDLLPIKVANIYACTKQPRHMSSTVNKFSFVLPYLKLFGGVTAIIANQFKNINGMSNRYFEWGGEDDDFYARLESHKLKLCRFEPETSEYHEIAPRLQRKRNVRMQQSRFPEDIAEDGLSSLKYTEVATVLHPLFTHIMVDL
ncbi:unnamed protein product [Parnassius mnemosyne]|uniref:Beta-1,4-N-acetylgalactosaminyltransferase n=1 Tax=Parnassius mnemosyne TaxID=213953 RepID=A0AAV1KJ62_9NEOP